MNRRIFLGRSLGLAVALPAAVQADASVRQRHTSDLSELTIAEASELIRSRALSPVDLLRAYLERVDRFNPRLNAFVTLTAEAALRQARQCEAEITKGDWRGPLHGIPVALKDNIDTEGLRTTAASAIFRDRVPTEDAEVTRRLKQAGAVLMGKTNMHEFAYGDTSGISHFGPVHNPWHADRVPGGSSGGSAAAVAARLCAAALGTDTGGSIRQPAASCGVVGLKPTYGLVSIRGIIPLAETQDHVGPICRSVEDAALMLQALAGYDPRDLWSIEAEIPDYRAATRRQASQLRVGVARKFFFEGLDPEISGATEEALSLIEEITASMREVEVPLTSLRVVSLEAYAWHRKFLQDETTRKLYQPRVLERLMKGTEVSASTYLEARRQQLQSRRDIEKVFEQVDVLVTPSCPVLPVGMKEGRSPSTPLALSLRNTAPFNANGIPTISMPCGFSREGLPIGLQISGPRLGEMQMFALAHAYEQATSWHKRRVPLS